MNAYKVLIPCLVALVLSFGLAACGGGGGGGGGGGVAPNPDRDGDGIPNAEDAFPDDAARFAAFETFVDPAAGTLFSVAVAASDGNSAVAVGQSDLGATTLRGQRWSLDPELENPQLLTETLNPLTGGEYSAAYGVNADGLAVGESASGLNMVPVYWVAGNPEANALSLTMTVGEVETIFAAGAAYSVNAGGQIVGEVMREDGSLMAVLWQPEAGVYGEPVALPEPEAGLSATAHFINAAGLVAGEALTAEGLRGVLWMVDAAGLVQGETINLGTLADHVASSAYGVDDFGWVVGESTALDGTIHGVRWELAGSTVTEIIELGAGSSAMAISADNNRIVGSATTLDELRAAVWDTRSTTPANFDAVISSGPDLFTPTPGSSRGYGMSLSGAVVGLFLDKAFVAIPQ